MRVPAFKVTYRELSESFFTHVNLTERGKSIEVKESGKVIAVIGPNSNAVTSEHTFSEAYSALNLRKLFDLVREGKDVVITRLGGKASVIITNPNKEDGPK